MAEYKCIQRMTTDGGKTIHEIGEIVDLSDKDVEIVLRLKAVEPVADNSDSTASEPTLAEVKEEEQQLQGQIDQMEHEGGAQL
jgi:DNA-binding transcriptional MerR regulator